MISIEVSREEIRLAMEQLKGTPKKILQAQNKAITKTVSHVKKELASKGSERYNVSKAVINKSFQKVKRFKTGHGTVAIIKSFGDPIPLVKFKPKPSEPFKKNRRTGEKRHLYTGKHSNERPRVTVEVLRGKRTVLKHSFLAILKNGHKGIFYRTTDKRLPIKQEYAPSIPAMLGNTKVWTDVVDNAEGFFNNAMEQELKTVLYTGKK